MLNSSDIKEELKRGNISVDFGEDNVGKNYIDVTLGDSLKTYTNDILECDKQNLTEEIIISVEGYNLQPGKLYLGRINEYTKTYNFVPLLSGLPELAAGGMEIHVTAGFGDNGFEGTWTLEIWCTNKTRVYPGMKIGRLYYVPLIGDNNIEYRGKYFRQVDTTESRLNTEYKDEERTLKYVNK